MTKRGFAIGVGLAALLAGLTLAGRAWIADRLAIVSAAPRFCLAASDQAKIAAGRFTPVHQDMMVVRAINSTAAHAGGPPRLWWRVRGALVSAGYKTFWTAEQRAAAYRAMIGNMRPCGQPR